MNDFWQSDYEVPYWAAALIFIAVFTTLGMGLFYGNLGGLIAVFAGLVRVGLGLFVIYLFYRFVVAVETIAEKQ